MTEEEKRIMNKKRTAVVVILCIMLCGCGKLNNEDIGKLYGNNSNDSYKVIWYSNILEASDNNDTATAGFPIENIVYSGNDVKLGISVTVNNEKMGNENIKLMCFLLINGTPVPFSVDGGERKCTNYTEVINGSEKVMQAEFYPYGIDEEDNDVIFVGVPFYDIAETQEPSENMVVYCKKNITSQVGATEKADMHNVSQTYFCSDITTDTYGKELYEISPYNGSIKDFIVKNDDGSMYFLGDYKASAGITYLFVDGEFFNGFDGNSSLGWDSTGKRFVNAVIDCSSLEPGVHSIYAVTVRSEEVVLARKSFSTTIEIGEGIS